jgi:hypothetical protein
MECIIYVYTIFMRVFPYNPYRKQMLVMAGGTWIVLLLQLLFIPPFFLKDVGWRDAYLPFYIMLALALFWSIWGISGRWKRSGTWSGAGVLLIYLRINQLDSWVNTLLLLGFCLVWEYYWYLSKQSPHLIK